jgi:hypothetical protein
MCAEFYCVHCKKGVSAFCWLANALVLLEFLEMAGPSFTITRKEKLVVNVITG